MRYRYIFLMIFLLIKQSLCSSHEKTEFNEVEIELIGDLVSLNEQGRNFIFFGYKLDFGCSNFTCEKYSISNLDLHLSIRGEKIYNKRNIDDYYAYLHNSRIENAGSSDRNIIILKFLSFFDEDIIVLDQIRAFNMKSFFIVFADNDEAFSNVRHHILLSELFNIYVIRRSSNSQVYLAYEVCAYCVAGKSQLKFYKRWQRNKGFNTPFIFSSSFKGSFFGAELKIGALVFPPVFFRIGMSQEGKPIYGGQQYLYLETLAKSLNFTIKLMIPNDLRSYDYDQKSKSWTGYYKMLLQRKVHLAGFPSGINYRISHIADLTGIHHIVHNSFISLKPAVEKGVKFEMNQTLLIVILFLCIIFISLMIILERIHGKHNFNRYVCAAFQIISILCLEAIRYRGLRVNYMIILALWIICSFFVIFNFFGEMISTATVNQPVTGYINTMEDMKDKNISWIQIPDYQFRLYEVLEQTLPEQAKYKLTMPLEEGLKFMIQNSSNYVYVVPKEGADAMIRFKFWDGKGENPFYISPPLLDYKPTFITPLVRKDAPYTREVTKKILQLDASGIYEYKYIPDTVELMGQLGKPKSSQSKKEEPKYEPISLKIISVYLYVCVFILCVATVVFIVEVCSPTIIRFVVNFIIMHDPYLSLSFII